MSQLKPFLAKRLNLFVLATLVILISACKKDSKPKVVDIYVAGSVVIKNAWKSPAYWKNGNIVKLDTSSAGELVAIAVQNNDVYCLGYTFKNSDFVLSYWKNGVLMNSTPNGQNCYPRDILVNGNDVYILADVYNFGNQVIDVPTVWKNGVKTELTDGKVYANSGSMALVGNDLYVAGYSRANSITTATVWKNGVAIKLSDGSKSTQASAITTQGSDLYVTGTGDFNNGVGLVWKNLGKADTLTKSGVITGIAVNGNDVYVAGTYINNFGSGIPTYSYYYLKNGALPPYSPIMSSSGTSSGRARFYNGSLYVAGSLNDRAGYWKDQTPITVSNSSSNASDVVIIEH